MKRIVIILIVAAAVAGGVWGAYHQYAASVEESLHELFAGTPVPATDTRTGFYKTFRYNWDAWKARGTPKRKRTEEPGLLDGPKEDEDWQRGVQGMLFRGETDASSSATQIAWLKSPTVYREAWVPRFLTIAYPTDGALFPPNICSPWVEWNDINNDLWQVTVLIPKVSKTWHFISRNVRWRMPEHVWREVKQTSGGGDVTLRVRGIRCEGTSQKTRDDVHISQRITFRISADRADNVIIYRLVAPPFINRKTPNTYARDIRKRRHDLFLSARKQYCINCHTFSSKSGTTGKLGLQVRYLGKREMKHRLHFAVFDLDRGEGFKTILPYKVQMSTFMSWSPDETKLAFSANQSIAAANPIVFETQSIGQPTSDIAVYDLVKGTVKLLPGAAGPDTIEIYPSWTPDGKRIVFSSVAKGGHPTLTQFNVMVVPYNDGNGGTPVPVRGAFANEKSNYYARFSPDGKWMSFVTSRYGSLIKASSDINIMPGNLKGRPIPLACNTPFAADSWHSWSSNSRWMVFASKRDDGIFARLYLTHIDENGNASPAVRLPIENPEMRMSFNIPEFVAEVPAVDEQALFDGISVDAKAIEPKSLDVKND